MRKRVLLAAIAGIAVLAVTVGLLRGQGDDLRVDAIEVGTGSVETNLALTGTVINDYTVSLTALLDGEIKRIEAREGDRIEAGTVLARLDDGPPRAQLDKAMAAVVLSRQELNLAARRVERMANLASAGSESSIALEDAELARQQAEAAEKSARADQMLAELALRNASVRAPYAGVVIEQDVEQGQWVEAGTRLFTLVAEAGRAIEAEVDAGDFARVAVGQPVSLALAETPEASWTSVIERIAESVTRGNGASGNTFTMRVGLGESAPTMLLGQQVDVDVVTASREAVIVIPLEAVEEAPDGRTRVWIDDGGKARRREVTLGLRSTHAAEVVDGLSSSERLLLATGLALEDGAAIVANAVQERGIDQRREDDRRREDQDAQP